jgi:biopolymer transport protein ExbB
LYEYIATNGFLSVAQENLAEAVPVEKTLSIFELLTSGGLAGNIIMASLFLMFLSHFIYTLSA